MDNLSLGLIVFSFLLNLVIVSVVIMLFLNFKKKEVSDAEKYKVTINGLLKHIRGLEQKMVEVQDKSQVTLLEQFKDLNLGLKNLEDQVKESGEQNCAILSKDVANGVEQVQGDLSKLAVKIDEIASFEELR